MQEPTAFDLLLGELSGIMTTDQLSRVQVVFSSWAGQEMHIPSKRTQLSVTAVATARKLLRDGVERPSIRDRLMGMGLSRPRAYRVIGRAQQDLRAENAQ